jgi:ribosome-binding factor A
MKTYRNERVASVITKNLNLIFQKEFDFGGALVTIVSTEVEKDLSQAKIKIAVIPVKDEIPVYQTINNKKKYLQNKLLKILNIKPMPTLNFLIEKHSD